MQKCELYTITNHITNIISKIDHIINFTSEMKKNDFVSRKDKKSFDAALFNICLIGETCHEIKVKCPFFFVICNDWFIHQAYEKRNRIIHSYDNVDEKIIWNLIRTYFPKTRKNLHRVLHKINLMKAAA